MKFACSLPIDKGDGNQFSSFAAIARMAKAVEDAGLDAVFVTDHPAPSHRWIHGGGHPTLDPFVALTAAASATERLQVLTYILVLAYRNPFVVAKSAASLDVLSNGRFVMGIGTGYLKPEYAAVGVSFEDRGQITEESILIMRKAWTGEPVQHESPRFTARDTVVLPRPVRPEGVPIWGGGNGNAPIRRAVELCEGWCPFPSQGILSKTARTEDLASIGQFREKLAYAQDHAAKIGRTRPLEICMGRFSENEPKPSDAGSAARAIDEYGELTQAGVTWTTMSVPAPSVEGFIENIQWFGEEIAAKVNSS